MDDNRRAPADYEVGWRKPPRHTRFKPNRSGNPKGRPPKSRNLKTDLVNELGTSISVRDGDREIKISKQEAFLKSLVARALQGDARASGLLVSLMARLLDLAASPPEKGLNTEDQAIIDAYVARRLESDRASATPKDLAEIPAKSGEDTDPSIIIEPKTEQSTGETKFPPDPCNIISPKPGV
jgi:hypothetical protein